jgi:hypothetical protein
MQAKTIYTLTSPNGQSRDFEMVEGDPAVYFKDTNRAAAPTLAAFEATLAKVTATGGTYVKHESN